MAKFFDRGKQALVRIVPLASIETNLSTPILTLLSAAAVRPHRPIPGHSQGADQQEAVEQRCIPRGGSPSISLLQGGGGRRGRDGE